LVDLPVVLESSQYFRVRNTGESAKPLLLLATDLQGNTERSQIEIAATKLGFRISRNIATGADTYERPGWAVVVIYDTFGKVVEVGAEAGSLVKGDLSAAMAALRATGPAAAAAD
jgi:hypothetical protein